MQNYGKKIAELRLASNMTQAELGKALSVTAQAVSKWEKGASEPDLNTIKSICEIFGITVAEFFGETKNDGVAAANASASLGAIAESEADFNGDETENGQDGTAPNTVGEEKPKPENAVVPAQTERAPIEVCSRCGKNLYTSAEFEIRKKYVDPDRLEFENPREVVCSDCLAKEKIDKKKAEIKEDDGKVSRGLIIGTIAGALCAIITAVAAADYFSVTELIFLAAAISYGAFAFVAQCFYCEFLIDMLLFFCRTLKFPAIIFSFDLEGIAFLIGLKILFAILGALFSITVFLFGLALCMAVAAVTFPFSFGMHKNRLAEKQSSVAAAEDKLNDKQD